MIGGTSLFGGRVSIPGAVFGALLAVILETGLVIQGLQPFYQLIASETVLIVAVYIRSRASPSSRREEGYTDERLRRLSGRRAATRHRGTTKEERSESSSS